jgi:hypothetical protein
MVYQFTLILILSLWTIVSTGVRVIGVPVNNVTNSDTLEWQLLASLSPHRYHSEKYELKMDYKLLNTKLSRFIQINSYNADDKNDHAMFALGEC